MAKFTQDELLEAFGEMTLVELSEFVKAFEEKFDVEASAPVAVAAAAAPGAAPAEENINPEMQDLANQEMISQDMGAMQDGQMDGYPPAQL